MNLSFEPPPPYDLGPDPDLGLWLTEWARETDRIVHLGPDDGRDHGQLCWDVLEPTGLLRPHCGHCTHGHGGPRDAREMAAALGSPVPPQEASPWIAATLIRDLVFRSGDGPMRPVADALGDALVDLLGPDARWRANGCAAYREGARGNVSWKPVTEATFDAAVVGIGSGHAVVIVATGED
ncbi:hypothetical protein F7Q99_32270 [Streptomyces kaniharaensis]|uniref:Uncharacterized protein n=1 Tax=Streptomyces kaniharaensis TaxID=212423 RepID=A0A6N7KZ89_9ACTN|nr:hypothetical protein [Streptomyces kaniharaensis]MQS16741.1 hypothetical protein [Streptomyces kaniharaensis]